MMKTRTTLTTVTQIVLAALLALPVGSHAQQAQAQPPIKVVLNGTPLVFTGTLPMQVKGSTLVPMRGIFEALGATVKFDKAAQTVYGQKGATAIILPLGTLTATVNGQSQKLPVPAELVNGSTLVPLRFISESLGASVAWDSVLSTVTIKTVDPHLAALPVVPGNTTIHGELTGLYTNTTPTQLTVRVGGENTTVPLADSTIILRSVTDKAAIEVPLTDLKPGDQVTVQRGGNGVATVVTATFGQVKGTIVSIGHQPNGNAALTLDSGRVIELVPGAPIIFDGSAVALSDIKPYETVVVRTNSGNSLGYGVAVSTASNPNPTPPGAAPAPAPAANPNAGVLAGNVATVEVSSFTDDARRPLRSGDVLKATLSGTPGGKATFAIPGVVDTVLMHETSPGVYVGSYLVVRNAFAHDASVLGRLIAGGVQSALTQAPGTLSIDTQPPKITDFGPAQAAVESDRPLIYATLADGPGTGVNPAATRLTVDGQSVSAGTETTSTLFTCKPAAALAAGSHTAMITVSDRAGNTATASWLFQVAPRRVIQSFTTNEPAGQAVGVGGTVIFALNAAPGGKARVTVGNLFRSLPLKEIESGSYTGEYTVRLGDNVTDAPVLAYFVSREGTTVTQSAPGSLTLAAGLSPAPRITFPKNSDYVDETAPLTVKGRALPNSNIRVVLTYTSKALGGILPVTGQSGSKDISIGRDGEWEADDFPLQIKSVFGANRDTVFTVTAVQLDTSGNPASDPATVQVRPG